MYKIGALFIAMSIALVIKGRGASTTGKGQNMANTKTPGAQQSGPRGIRNNNPGNIEKGENWRGLAADQSGDDRFAVFSSPVWGIRAMARVLKNYYARYGLVTIRAVIARWAPASENNVDAYARSVAARVGVSPDARIAISSDAVLLRMVPAMIQHENGQQPYSQDLIAEGVRLA
jgi:hypothetical protein